MSDDLVALETWIGGVVQNLEPAGRRRLARRIATMLRKSQAARIAAQKNPDGAAYEPRKRAQLSPGQLRKRTARMFPKLRSAEHLRAEATESEASVGFANPTVARVALVHQLGLRDRVTRKPNAPEVVYPRRELLGFTPEDRFAIADLVLEQVSAE